MSALSPCTALIPYYQRDQLARLPSDVLFYTTSFLDMQAQACMARVCKFANKNRNLIQIELRIGNHFPWGKFNTIDKCIAFFQTNFTRVQRVISILEIEELTSVNQTTLGNIASCIEKGSFRSFSGRLNPISINFDGDDNQPKDPWWDFLFGVTTLRHYDCDARNSLVFLSQCKDLKSLHLNFSSSEMGSPELSSLEFLEEFQGLESLHLNSMNPIQCEMLASVCPPSVRDLTIYVNTTTLTDQHMLKLLARLPNLQALNIDIDDPKDPEDSLESVEEVVEEAAAEAEEEVEAVEEEAEDTEESPNRMFVPRKERFSGISDQTLEALPKLCPNLRSLSLRHALKPGSKMTTGGVISALSGLKLRELIVDSTISDALLDAISKFQSKSLAHLSLHDCYGYSEEALMRLGKACQNLLSASVYCCFPIYDPSDPDSDPYGTFAKREDKEDPHKRYDALRPHFPEKCSFSTTAIFLYPWMDRVKSDSDSEFSSIFFSKVFLSR